MILPPQDPEISFGGFLKELPEDYHERAYEFKAFTRARKLKSPAQLMQVVMQYSGIDSVLRETAGNFTLLHERITDTAIEKRLKACLPWLKALLRKMWPGMDKAAGHLRFVVVDGSTVQGPGAKGTEHRLHVMMDLLKLELLYVEVTDSHQGEGLQRYPFKEGDVVVADRGYNQPARIIELSAKGVCVVIRLTPWAMPLHWRDEEKTCPKHEGRNGQVLDIYAHLQETKADKVCLPVWLGTPEKAVEGWVHACRLPPEKAEAARRRCRQESKKTPNQKTLFLAGWVMVFTTVPPEILDTDTVLALYGLRWQVELLIKRLKSLLDVDALRTKQNSKLGQVWLHGKLLYALVLEKRARKRFGVDWARLAQETCPERSRRERPASWWRLWKIVRTELAGWIRGWQCWKEENQAACLHVMQERPRRRKLQMVPAGIQNRLQACRSLGLAEV